MHKEQIRFASGMNLMLGLWLFFSPIILGFNYSLIATVEAMLFGLIVMAIAWLRLLHPERARYASAINLILGLILIVSAFLLGASGVEAAQWNDLSIGIPLALFAMWSTGAYVRPGE